MAEPLVPGAWSVDMEVNLFHAMRGMKPVGVNRHFTMAAIHAKLNTPSTKHLSSKDVWDHLSTMYDLQALNESEQVPFPNDPANFKLPEFEYRLFVENSEFPRMQNVGMAPTSAEDARAKPEGQAKGGKSSRSDSKASHQQSKGNAADSKGSSSRGDKGGTPDNKSSQNSKADSKSGGSAGWGSREGKGGSSKAGGAHSAADHTPKRTKRTRVGQSANSSPASSEAPPPKRRR